MPTNLDLITTVIILMMENRSFDHMLGYLSIPRYADSYAGRAEIKGLSDDQAWLDSVANEVGGYKYWPRPLQEPRIPDPPHEWRNIALQMGGKDGSNRYTLDGFAASANDPEVMNYQTPDKVPVLDFLARNFMVCDQWYSCLPASTQPNRLMALSGHSLIDGNVTILPDQRCVYDWLNTQGVMWRVYHQGPFPFVSLMPWWFEDSIFGEQFRSFDRFAVDALHEADSTFPEVIFIEPCYTDGPHEGVEGTDDHSPSSVYGGQQLMLDVYNTLIESERWDRCIFIITYDEHGGFFDHEQPLVIETVTPSHTFDTSGIRVPAVIVSPYVSAGAVSHVPLDHTSILKFLGEKFGLGNGYSKQVDDRPIVHSVSEVLDLASARSDKPKAPDKSVIPRVDLTKQVKPGAPNKDIDAFRRISKEAKIKHAHPLATKFPSLGWLWRL